MVCLVSATFLHIATYDWATSSNLSAPKAPLKLPGPRSIRGKPSYVSTYGTECSSPELD